MEINKSKPYQFAPFIKIFKEENILRIVPTMSEAPFITKD